MKKFLIVGSSLAPVFCAATAGAVDITLGGSIDMGIEFGLGKNNSDLSVQGGYNEVTLSISAAHTTDDGLAFGGAFELSTSAEIEFNPYADAAGDKYLAKLTVDGRTNINADLWNVSGGVRVPSNDVVSVKINSSWLGIDKGQTEYTLPLGAFGSHNICKIAGRGTVNSSTADVGFVSDVGMYDGTGKAWTQTKVGFGVEAFSNEVTVRHKSGYLPAVALVTPFLVYSAVVTATVNDRVVTQPTEKSHLASAKTWSFGMDYGDVVVKNSAFSEQVTAVARYDDYGTTVAVAKVAMPGLRLELPGGEVVEDAAVRLGPFMEVKMASSETKMVVGAACLSGVDSTDTKFYMDNASRVMTVSDASIFIEGGFGKLTLQTGDYAGGVGAIAGAGDRADIDADGLVVIAQGTGLMGANPYLAVDLAAGDTFGAFEVITGGTLDLGGLALGFDMALDNDATDPLDVFGISAWDLGASYAMGDLSLAFATDSSSDWGLSASMAIAGFGVSTTFGSKSGDDHTKSGITYSVSASTALNGFGLAIGFDQDLQPTIGVDYDLGGLKLYAGYDAGDEGGKVGATLSF
ncbi:MAG: hypothetical protein CBC49_005165 [Alphaproteobacteria bacterium TMED89]|nr:MAG: hypothetical protein CBC49_005165 [Alphaproteobacteria bacterium TMED89]